MRGQFTDLSPRGHRRPSNIRQRTYTLSHYPYRQQSITRGHSGSLQKLGVQGVIFSDDLTMAAAGEAGSTLEQAKF